MKTRIGAMTLVAVMLAAGSLYAAEKGKGRDGKRGRDGAGDRIGSMLKDLNLTDEQTKKIGALREQYGPKLKEAGEKMQGIQTDEQRTARREAMKAAKDAGKPMKDIFEAGEAATKLTDEQKTKMADARKAMEAVGKELREKISAVLTPEQQEKFKKAMESRQERGPRGKTREK
jgi:Spy/CpxP family protein refolding chaperone